MSDMIPLQEQRERLVDEALLRVREDEPQSGVGQEDRNGVPWLIILGFLMLSFNSGLAIYRSRGDSMAIAFVAFSYMDLLLLFYYLRWYERVPPESWRRVQMKAAIWGLTTTLAGMFAYQVAAVMPLPAAVLVWVMAGAAALGFYAFFVHQEEVGILGRPRALLPRSAPVS